MGWVYPQYSDNLDHGTLQKILPHLYRPIWAMKKGPKRLFRGFFGDEMILRYMGSTITHCKDPYETNQYFMESKGLRFFSWLTWEVLANSGTSQNDKVYISGGLSKGWKKSCTSWYGESTIIYRVLPISGGCLGFLPSTVFWRSWKKMFINGCLWFP